ncbi:MAG: signal peptidase I [Opitutae bacterium]|nr:signal peptidase I [Opitutae bacterium]
MFGFFLSEEKKMRQHAANWLEVADRVWHYRRDLLTATQSQSLQSAVGDLKQRLKEKADASRLKLAAEALERVLRAVGGRVYPTTSLAENVEFLLVAAIVILGIRAYFVQPFKIPTNSMWPSYYGMTHELFRPGDEPGVLRKVARFATLGATHYSLAAPADGEVLVPVLPMFRNLRVAYADKPGRSMVVFPSVNREYTFSVGGQLTTLTVPADFDFERVLEEAFKGREPSLAAALNASAEKNQPLETSTINIRSGGRQVAERVYWVPLGKTVKRGEPILSFDILTGDLLFVDRFSYNFVPPKVGSGFVFKTGNIPDLKNDEGDKYFIKRLVGVPGDTLEIRQPAAGARDGGAPDRSGGGQLFRNGKPIEGSEAFAANARKEGLYPGYTNEGLLGVGKVMSVPAHSYVALGDNSPRSKDSRFWGYVPEKDVVGRPLFIYYPLTKRWGPAR